MATRYYLRLPEPSRARGSDPAFAFHSEGAEGLAAELQSALAEPAFFERWRAAQDDPDGVPSALAGVDPAASVSGRQHDLVIELVATTSLSGSAFKHRLRLLAGSGWELRDVRAG
jgi:hypothetical protein